MESAANAAGARAIEPPRPPQPTGSAGADSSQPPTGSADLHRLNAGNLLQGIVKRRKITIFALPNGIQTHTNRPGESPSIRDGFSVSFCYHAKITPILKRKNPKSLGMNDLGFSVVPPLGIEEYPPLGLTFRGNPVEIIVNSVAIQSVTI